MSQHKLVIGNKNYSTWSLRGWLACQLAGLSFEEVFVDMSADDFRETAKEYSGAGKVPALLIGDAVIWDSLSIAEYAAEYNPEIWPRDKLKRATARALAAEMHSSFSAVRQALPMNIRATGRQVPITEAIIKDIRRIDQIFTEQIQQFGGPYLFGQNASVADCFYAPIISRFKTYGLFEHPDVMLSPQTNIYRDTILQWDLFKEWTEGALKETQIVEEDEAG